MSILLTMDLSAALLESWDRQYRIVTAVASLVDESNRASKPSEDGWDLAHQLAHIHKVRWEWLGKVAPHHAATLGDSFIDGWMTPIADLAEIKSLLTQSGTAIRAAMAELLEGDGAPIGGYDHPVLFLQHMVWHEGWHVGLIFLALRNAGVEPTELWEETNVWGHWRTEAW